MGLDVRSGRSSLVGRWRTKQGRGGLQQINNDIGWFKESNFFNNFLERGNTALPNVVKLYFLRVKWVYRGPAVWRIERRSVDENISSADIEEHSPSSADIGFKILNGPYTIQCGPLKNHLGTRPFHTCKRMILLSVIINCNQIMSSLCDILNTKQGHFWGLNR